MRPIVNIAVGTIVLVACAFASWTLTNRVQTSVPIVPGLDGCSRLETPAAQIDCLSDVFTKGANKAASTSRGKDRDQKVIDYVRRAERLASGNPRLSDTCHPSMHELGRNEGSRAAREDRPPTFPGGSSQLCTAGYVHGLAEGYLATSPAADVAGVFPDLCSDLNARAGCAHGIGHSLIRAEHSTNLAAQRSALTACETLPENYISDCYNGVYMELTMINGTAKLSPTEFSAGCAVSSNVERELSCWSYLPLSLAMSDVPIREYPSWCAKSDLPGQFTCVEAFGRQLGIDRVERCPDSGSIRALQERCIEGAVGLQVGSGHVERSNAERACTDLRTSRLRSYCTRAVDRYASGRAKVEAETSM